MAKRVTPSAVLMIDEEGYLLVRNFGDNDKPVVPVPDPSQPQENLDCQKKNAELQASLQAALKRSDELQTHVSTLLVEKGNLETTLETVQATLREAREKLSPLTSENVQLKTKIADLEKQVATLRARIADLEKGVNPTPAPVPTPTPVPPVQPPWSGVTRAKLANVWGPGRHAMDALRNLTVGSRAAGNDYGLCIGFTATDDGPLDKLWYYVPYGTGYHGNDAGVLKCTILPANPGNWETSEPNEGASSLGSFTRDLRAMNRSRDAMYEDSFTGAQPLTKGGRYYLLFSNEVKQAGTFYSINCTQIRRASGYKGIRWDDDTKFTIGFRLSPTNGWTDLSTLNVSNGTMVTSPMLRMTYKSGHEDGSVIIESGAVQGREVTLAQSRAVGTTPHIREAMYIPFDMTVRAISLVAENMGYSDALQVSLVTLKGEGLTNEVTSTLATKRIDQTGGPAKNRLKDYPDPFIRAEWYDVELDAPTRITGGQWVAVDITAPQGSWRFAGQTNARRRGTEGGGKPLEMPVAYIDGEARLILPDGQWGALNYHNRGVSNGTRNDVNWRGICLHVTEDVELTTKRLKAGQPAPTPPVATPGNGTASTGFRSRTFNMSTANNPRLIHAWVDGRVDNAVKNGTSGQGGGAAISMGMSQKLHRDDGWMLDPWINTGNLEWVLKQDFFHYTPWFVFIEIDGSPNKAPAPEVAIRNLRFWILPKGSNTWQLLSSQSTGFWCAYFYPDMGRQISGDISGTPYEGGTKYQFRGNTNPWPALHGSGAQYRFDRGGVFDGIMVTCEAKLLTPGAEVALQFGCDAKIFGDNKTDRVYKNESDKGWYPGVGMSRCEPITTEWVTYGFCPTQRQDGSVRDGKAAYAMPYSRWENSVIPAAQAPELGR